MREVDVGSETTSTWRSRILAATVGLCLGGAALAQSSADRSMVVTPLTAATFVPSNPQSPDSLQIAVLWGDPDTGPSAMLMKLKKGPSPWHSHSSDYHSVVLQGVMKHWGEGQTEAEALPLKLGGYWFQPADQIHADSCLTDECLIHIVWSGKSDSKRAPAPH